MTTTLDVEVRVVSSAEWPIVRDARLAALRADPQAYVATYEEEDEWEDDAWQRTFEASCWVIATDHSGSTVGLLQSVSEEDEPFARYVEAIWVAPHCRRRGVLRRMLHFLAEHEAKEEVTRLKLWVLESNSAVMDVYPHVGFRLTGLRQELGSTYERQFSRMIASP